MPFRQKGDPPRATVFPCLARRPRVPPRRAPAKRRLVLLLRPWERTAFAILNVLPLPGLGAIVVGARNPHTRLLRNGSLQLTLVVLGSWPLVLPGLAGLAWAGWDAFRMHEAELAPLPSPPAQ